MSPSGRREVDVRARFQSPSYDLTNIMLTDSMRCNQIKREHRWTSGFKNVMVFRHVLGEPELEVRCDYHLCLEKCW